MSMHKRRRYLDVLSGAACELPLSIQSCGLFFAALAQLDGPPANSSLDVVLQVVRLAVWEIQLVLQLHSDRHLTLYNTCLVFPCQDPQPSPTAHANLPLADHAEWDYPRQNGYARQNSSLQC